MFVSWVIFPLVLALPTLGCGLLLERAARVRLPGLLLLPAGFAVIIVVAQFATMSDQTSELATPAVLLIAVAGLVLSPPWRRGDLDVFALGSAVGVFTVFAAPVVLSGHATFAGFIRLDDIATWLGITDQVMEHGRHVSGLAPSTYEANMRDYVGSGYPIGAFLPLGVARPLVGQDVAWVFQPYMAFTASMLALSLYALLRRLVELPWVRAIVVFVAAQAALTYGYSLVGGIKEVASACVLALIGALLVPLLGDERDTRVLLPLAVAVAAAFAIMSYGALVWLAPAVVAAAAVFVRSQERPSLRPMSAFAIATGLLLIPMLVVVFDFLDTSSGLREQSELGNLVKPLKFVQVFGIWPAGDFRLTPDSKFLSYALVGVAIASAIGGLAWLGTRRHWDLLAYFGTAVFGVIVLSIIGAPWVDAKAMAIAAPAFLLAAMLGAVALFNSGWRFEAGALAIVIAAGVFWSNLLAYHEVNLAPRDRLAELQKIGDRIEGDGPTLMIQNQVYGVRHFLRKAGPESPVDLHHRKVLLLGGKTLPYGAYADIDEFELKGLLAYRTLVLSRSPVASRPPSSFHLTWSGRYYEVWQKPQSPTSAIRAHLPLGSLTQPIAVPRCRDVMRLAREAGRGGQLTTVERRPTTVVPLSATSFPPAWRKDADPNLLYPSGNGTLQADLRISNPLTFGVWLGGASRRPIELRADGKKAGRLGYGIDLSGDYRLLATIPWEKGVHRVALVYGGGALHPGSGGQPLPIGPLVLATGTANQPVLTVPAAKARSLCRKPADWIEAISPV